MTYVPMPHQVEDAARLLEFQHGLLWADAGTGKTITAIHAINEAKIERVLVIAPKIAITMWYEELKKHTSLEYIQPIRSSGNAKRKQAHLLAADAIITTYDLCANPTVGKWLRQFLRSEDAGGSESAKAAAFHHIGKEPYEPRKSLLAPPNSVVILDEAHYVKNREAKRTKAVLGATLDGRQAVTLYAPDVWFLTGDPVMRHVDDLFTQLKFARPEILAHYGVETYDKFVDRFCVSSFKKYHPMQAAAKRVITGSKNLDVLNRLLDDCAVIKRKLVDVEPNMPPITISTVDVDMSGEAVKSTGKFGKLSVAELERMLADPDSELSRARRLVGVGKSSDVAAHVASSQSPVLVGAWHIDVIDAIKAELAERQPNWVVRAVTGKTSSTERDHIQEGFNCGTVDVIVGQMSAMNVSWNLQSMCRHVVIAEEIPSHGMLHQFYSRVHRKGQVGHVHVDLMMADHDVDIALRRIRDEKAVTKARINA